MEDASNTLTPGPESLDPGKRIEFLSKDYEKCFEQLRFYDDREISALKYLYTISSAVASLIFTVYGTVEKATPEFFGFISFVSIIVFVTGLILLLSALQNRVYFASTATHINLIRDYFIQNAIPDDDYYREKRHALNLTSLHTFIILGAILLSSLFLGLFFYTLNPASGQARSLTIPLIAFALSVVIQFVIGILYLYRQDKKTKTKLENITVEADF